MMRKKPIITLFIINLLFLMLIPFISSYSKLDYSNQNIGENPKPSASLEGLENVIITNLTRNADISSYGLLNIEDAIIVKNLNNNPLLSILIAIPLSYSDELIFFESTGENRNTLLTERSYMIMNNYEMIVIYFDSPLLPFQSRLIYFKQTYKNLLKYSYTNQQLVEFSGFIYPLLPYKIEAAKDVLFQLPEQSSNIQGGWGIVNPSIFTVLYKFENIRYEIGDNYIEPFLENLGDTKDIAISFNIDTSTKIEIIEINRELFISPWGIIKIKENLLFKNLGVVPISTLNLNLPLDAKKIFVFDSLGEILGVTISKNSEYKDLQIELRENRVILMPNSSFRFNIQYYLPFEKYVSLNWFEESIKIDILTTDYDYLGSQQTIKLIIEGCQNINAITFQPEAIDNSRDAVVLIFKSDFVAPLEDNIIQLTITINIFELLLRPIIFILIITLILTSFVVILKLRKKEESSTIIRKEIIPVNEIREFCSLYEEKNALVLEIRKTEEDTKRKKITKKSYKNILDKNTLKIEEIQKEIMPFKKTIIETNEIFENIMKKLDILEAERLSVGDSLNLLETRYKRGRLPSRAAYLKLSEDFKKRRKKIDRNIDKFTQQLRSYLL